MLFNFSRSGYKEGDDVKNLELTDTQGNKINLEGKWTILYFYPKDDTPGCTAQAIGYSTLLTDFEQLKAQVIAINTETETRHDKFKEKYKLKVRQVSDKKGEFAKAFGIRMIFGLCARDTILINPKGKIERIMRGVDPKLDPENMLKLIRNAESSENK